MLLLFVGILKNNWQLAFALLVALVGLAAWKTENELYRHELSHNEALASELGRVHAAGLAQAKAAAKATAVQQDQVDAISSQLQSALKAHALTGVALTASVQRYEDARGRGAVCPGAGTSVGAGHSSDGQGAGRHRLDQSIARAPEDCQLVIDQLKACQSVVRSLPCATFPR